MAETTYHREKMYLPREIQEKMGLEDGDRIHIEVVDRGEARIRVVRRIDASKRIMELLEDPPDLGKVLSGLSRREIYGDIAGH
jgi:bifunctional DNA-binding transcriptional regulator/antitoxin component of YhaV-PrlF toxin-antitoxin module